MVHPLFCDCIICITSFTESCHCWTKETISSTSYHICIYVVYMQACLSWAIQTVRYYNCYEKPSWSRSEWWQIFTVGWLRCDLAYFLREDKFVDLGCPNGVLACGLAQFWDIFSGVSGCQREISCQPLMGTIQASQLVAWWVYGQPRNLSLWPRDRYSAAGEP